MQILKSRCTDAYYNLAWEEILFEQFENCIFIWQNDNSVIVGRNQNIYSEVNLPIAEQLNTKIVRRNTGGGAVYHDLNNINFSFCFQESQFSKEIFIHAILDFLQTLSISAELSGRNDILLNGKKISGCAELSRNGRTLFHGTLLFNTDTDRMQKLLNVSAEKMVSKGIDSVKSRVANLKSYCPNDWNAQIFMQNLYEYLKKTFNAVPANTDEKLILNLAKEKYITYEWNFGRNPKFNLIQKKRFSIGEIEVCLNVEKNIIKECKFCGDFIGRLAAGQLADKFLNVPYEKNTLIQFLHNQNISDYFGKISEKDFAELFFTK